MKTKITSISYGKTINMGNYESTRIDFIASVSDTEDWKEVLDDLKTLVLKEEKRIKKEGF